MNNFDPNKEYPQDLEGMRPYVDPKSKEALSDLGLALLRKASKPTAFGAGASGRYEAISILSKEYGRNIDWNIADKKESKGLPQWFWLLGAAALVGWYVMRNNKKGIFGMLKGKTFDAGDLS